MAESSVIQMRAGVRFFGDVPVPFTVSWTGEESFFVGKCEHAGNQLAICQKVDPGVGKPRFGKPHSQRQRQAIVHDLCDLCGKPLKNKTKVSLSHARVRENGADGPCVMQTEPLLHRACAVLSMLNCPSLKRDIEAGALEIWQVTRNRPQLAVMGPKYIQHYVPDYPSYQFGPRVIGHAKVELLGFTPRDVRWLVVG